MKKLSLLVILFTTLVSYGQLTVTNNGKVVKELTCEMDNLNISMPIPSNYSTYDKIKITIGQYRPNGGYLFDYLYDIEFNSVYFEGKNKIDLMLLNSEEKSDLYTGWYVYYSLHNPCVDGNRDFTVLENKVKILGAKHTGWEWKGDKKVKTYTYDVLKSYTINHSLGEITNDFYGAKQAFKINKFDKGESEVSNYDDKQYVLFTATPKNNSGSDVMSMGGPSKVEKNGEIHLVSEVFKSSEISVEDVKKGLEFLLIRQANPNFTVNGTNIPFDHNSNFMIQHYWPKVIGGVKQDTEKAPVENKSNKFKSITNKYMPTSSNKSGPSKDVVRADIENMLANTGAYFTWETKTINGVSVAYIELDVYEKKQMSSYDSGARYVKPDEQGKSRKLKFYVANKNGSTIAIAIYKSLTEGLNDSEEGFMSNFESTFTWN